MATGAVALPSAPRGLSSLGKVIIAAVMGLIIGFVLAMSLARTSHSEFFHPPEPSSKPIRKSRESTFRKETLASSIRLGTCP
jgi:formate hydrogenlyase subunit 3/multisubunit Na+/H+ antiporter MnhD subunit